ncbi:MAG: hypothetical protein HRT44_14300, partial [Bdellovibrionales bacterium]|nr:hypothetical protein [Bdellovibrionales bacterium]
MRFKKFTDAISETQYKVFQMEHRRDNDYLSQKEKALMLGLKHDNYKYHLKRCEEVLFKIYPEFEKKYRRIKGGKTVKETKPSPETLYRIVNGERKEIPFPEKKKRQLSGREAFRIRRWAFETTYNKDGNLA